MITEKQKLVNGQGTVTQQTTAASVQLSDSAYNELRNILDGSFFHNGFKLKR